MSMNTIAEDVKDILVEAGVGGFAATGGWSIHMNAETDNPINMITIYNTPSSPPINLHDKTYSARSPSFQIRVRAKTDALAYEKIQEVDQKLNKKGNFTVNTTVYGNILRVSEFLQLPKETKSRFIWVCEYVAFRQDNAEGEAL